MNARWLAALLFIVFRMALATQAPLALPAPPSAEYVQRLGAQLPLDLPFRDSDGREKPLHALFGGPPVLLVLGYYQCPQLCSTVMQSVLESLAASRLPAYAYRIVAISIDPREDWHLASRKRDSYLAQASHRSPPDLHLLTGPADSIRRVAQAAGFNYSQDENRQYAHAAGIVVASPDGHVSRYLLGVDFHERDLRLALADASQGRTGSLADRLLLLCAHYDPATGRYDFAVMTGLRLLALGMLAGFAVFVWKRRQHERWKWPTGRRA